MRVHVPAIDRKSIDREILELHAGCLAVVPDPDVRSSIHSAPL